MSSAAASRICYARSPRDLEKLSKDLREGTLTFVEVDFSQCNLSASNLSPVLDICRRCPNLRVLKLYRNSLDDSAAKGLVEILSKPATQEVHLSHNMFTLAGVEILLEASKSRSDELPPLWMRLEQNCVAEPKSAWALLDAKFSICNRDNEIKCTSRFCCIKRKVHLPFFESQRSVAVRPTPQPSRPTAPAAPATALPSRASVALPASALKQEAAVAGAKVSAWGNRNHAKASSEQEPRRPSMLLDKNLQHRIAPQQIMRAAEEDSGKETEAAVCVLCKFIVTRPIITRCHHLFCDTCFKHWAQKEITQQKTKTLGSTSPVSQIPCPRDDCRQQLRKTDVMQLDQAKHASSWKFLESLSIRCVHHKEHHLSEFGNDAAQAFQDVGVSCAWSGSIASYEEHLSECPVEEHLLSQENKGWQSPASAIKGAQQVLTEPEPEVDSAVPTKVKSESVKTPPEGAKANSRRGSCEEPSPEPLKTSAEELGTGAARASKLDSEQQLAGYEEQRHAESDTASCQDLASELAHVSPEDTLLALALVSEAKPELKLAQVPELKAERADSLLEELKDESAEESHVQPKSLQPTESADHSNPRLANATVAKPVQTTESVDASNQNSAKAPVVKDESAEATSVQPQPIRATESVDSSNQKPAKASVAKDESAEATGVPTKPMRSTESVNSSNQKPAKAPVAKDAHLAHLAHLAYIAHLAHLAHPVHQASGFGDIGDSAEASNVQPVQTARCLNASNQKPAKAPVVMDESAEATSAQPKPVQPTESADASNQKLAKASVAKDKSADATSVQPKPVQPTESADASNQKPAKAPVAKDESAETTSVHPKPVQPTKSVDASNHNMAKAPVAKDESAEATSVEPKPVQPTESIEVSSHNMAKAPVVGLRMVQMHNMAKAAVVGLRMVQMRGAEPAEVKALDAKPKVVPPRKCTAEPIELPKAADLAKALRALTAAQPAVLPAVVEALAATNAAAMEARGSDQVIAQKMQSAQPSAASAGVNKEQGAAVGSSWLDRVLANPSSSETAKEREPSKRAEGLRGLLDEMNEYLHEG